MGKKAYIIVWCNRLERYPHTWWAWPSEGHQSSSPSGFSPHN